MSYVQAHLCVPSVKPSVCMGISGYDCVLVSVCVFIYLCTCHVCMCSHITLALMSSFSGMGEEGGNFLITSPNTTPHSPTPQARAHPYCPLRDTLPPSGTRPRADFFQLLCSAFPGPHVVCEELNPEAGQARVPRGPSHLQVPWLLRATMRSPLRSPAQVEGTQGFLPQPGKDLERPSSTRLEARVPSHGSRAMTSSPSPLAWRPDFPGAPREAH